MSAADSQHSLRGGHSCYPSFRDEGTETQGSLPGPHSCSGVGLGLGGGQGPHAQPLYSSASQAAGEEEWGQYTSGLGSLVSEQRKSRDERSPKHHGRAAPRTLGQV